MVNELVNALSVPCRRIEPLESDLSAWLDFLRHWISAPDPRSKLAEFGLEPADVMRLQAHWSAQMARDAGLFRLAAERLAAPPRAAPVVIVRSAHPDDQGSDEMPPVTVRDSAPRATRPVLPFVAPLGDGRAEPVAVRAAPAERPSRSAPARPASLFDTADVTPLRVPALPFVRPRAVAAPAAPTAQAPPAVDPLAPTVSAGVRPSHNQEASLSLEFYASLCAELAVFTGQAEEVFARYGLQNVRERREFDQRFQARLQRDPRQFAAWQRLYARYFAHWSSLARRQ